MTPDRPAAATRHVEQISTMGTVVSIDVRGPCPRSELDRAVRAVTARLHEIDELFSTWKPDSWVSRLVQGRAGLPDCPTEVQDVVAVALTLMEHTQGYFSPFWRGRPSSHSGPDPTGLVKGWAAQEASDVLLAHGMPDHVVNAAGDLVVSGHPQPGPAIDQAGEHLVEEHQAWRVGIADPGRTAALTGAVDVDARDARWAVATSGPAERGHHICDPVTGTQAVCISSATAIAAITPTNHGGATVDACATALVAAGHDAPSLLQRLGPLGVHGFVISIDGTRHDPEGLMVPV